MSKVKLLIDVISDVRSLADSLQAVANAMTENEPADEPVVKAPKEAKAKAESKKTAAKEKPAEVKLPTLEEVRSVLATKSREGHTAEVKELLIKHGANKLSEIAQKEYPALLADAEVL